MRVPLLLLLACTATACATRVTPTGRWFGPLTPNAESALCPPARASLLLSDGEVTFTPDEGIWVLTGKATPDGTIVATRQRPGANKQPYVTRLDAHWTDTAITGTYATPRCTYAVALQRR